MPAIPFPRDNHYQHSDSKACLFLSLLSYLLPSLISSLSLPFPFFLPSIYLINSITGILGDSVGWFQTTTIKQLSQ